MTNTNIPTPDSQADASLGDALAQNKDADAVSQPPNTPKSPKRPKPFKSRLGVYLIRLLITAIVAVVLLLLLLFYAAGTEKGTQLIIEKIALETGTKLKYSEGTIRDGLWVSDVEIAQGEDITVTVNRAYVQLGWRAIFARQVHLVNPQIDTVEVTNRVPSTGEPFGYPTIKLPVDLQLDNADIKTIRYLQAGADAVILHDISSKQAIWSGTAVKLSDTALSYGDVVTVSHANGQIDLSGQYPLSATADVHVHSLDRVHFDTLQVQAGGTLKRTAGTLTSKYNQHDISGSFIAQGLDENSPFHARLDFDEVVLPYAEEQHITLKDGTIIADGVVSNIDVRINTDLSAKDIPSGRYRGRGIVRDGGMDIPFLAADTPQGELTASGKMEWSDEFELDATLSGDGFKVREAMPAEYREYAAYLPKDLSGSLGVRYFLKDNNDDTRFEFALRQKDGERIDATLAQSQRTAAAPWRISADFANIRRSDVPKIGNINAKAGSVSLRLEEGRTYIDAKADIIELNAAPKGSYVVLADIEKGERINLTDFRYDGVMGDLAGTGRIDLATANRPLSWQLDAKTQSLRPNAYLGDGKTPIEALTGYIKATGRMREADGLSIHDITLSATDLTAQVMNGKHRDTVAFKGDGKSTVYLKGSDVQRVVAELNHDIRAALTLDERADISATGRTLADIRFKKVGNSVTVDTLNVGMDADVVQTALPQLGRAKIGVDAKGTMDALSISRLSLDSDQGRIDARGKLNLQDGVAWDMTARLDDVNTAKFVNNNNLIATISGDLVTSGKYANQQLGQTTVRFDGRVVNDRVPDGKLGIDITGTDKHFEIRRLTHSGAAGSLSATGMVDISRGIRWQANATMQNLNIGAYIKDMPSNLTGHFNTRGDWHDTAQMVELTNLDVKGSFNGQPLSATGALYAKLALPKDFSAYLNRIKQTTQRPRSRGELLSLRQRIDMNARESQRIIQSLRADNLNLRLGENHIMMDGSDSQLTTSVNVTDLSQIINTAPGVIKGGVILINDDNALPTLYVDMAVKDVRMRNLVISEANAIGKIINLGNSPSQLVAQGKDIIVLGKVIREARLDFSGTESAHTLSFATQSADVTAEALIQGSLNRDTMRYTGVLADAQIDSRFGAIAQRQPTEFSVGLNDSSVQIAPHCWQTLNSSAAGEGVICLQDTLRYSEAAGNVNVVIQNLDTRIFSSLLPSDIEWDSVLNGYAKAAWAKGRAPVVDAAISSDNGRIALNQPDVGYVEMPYKRGSVVATSVANGLRIRTDLAGVAGVGYADVVVDPYTQSKPIAGMLAMDEMNLAVLRPFFSNLQNLSGKVSMAGGLRGTLSRPQFYGKAKLDQGSLAIVGVPMHLTDMNVTADINGMNAALNGGFKAGDGQASIHGDIDWAGQMQARIGISGENLAIRQPPVVTAEISPDLEIVVRPFQKFVDVQGVVVVPSATIRPPEASAEIVTESGDVSVLDRRIVGNLDKILAVAQPWSINASIGVDLGRRVEFRGFGARLPLAGALHLTQSGQGTMQALGVVQVSERTKIDAIGQNLELNYAQIRFNGDILNPRLSIEGEREIEGQMVGVRVRGTAGSPDITVFNDAGLTEQQAMNALLTGRISESSDPGSGITEQGFRSQVTNSLAAAGLSLGLSGTRNLTNQIGQALGLDSLTIDASGGSHDANVNITGYVTPDLYIRYGVGVFNAEQSLSMRYQLTRRVFVEATRATENMVDVIYRWKF